MVTVACVLRSGGQYEPWHVWALQDGVRSHLPLPHRFVCLTDMDVPGVETTPLRHDWPGWWSKMELWAPGNFTGRVLFLDLDTAITGDLSDIASYSGRFAMLQDLGIRPLSDRPGRKLGASGVMAWTVTPQLTRDLYEAFSRTAESAMEGRQVAGDQHYIAGAVNEQWDDLRSLYPGQIVSWKLHVRANEFSVPADARIICWHGTPKPWDEEVGWIEPDRYRRAA